MIYRNAKQASAENPQRPSKEGACHRSDGLTLPKARHLGPKAALAQEFDTASELPGNRSHGASCSPQANGLCRFMPRSCISASHLGRLLRLLSRATFFAAEITDLQAPKARMHCSDGMHLLEQGIWLALEATACCPPVGATPKSLLPNRALSESGFAHDTPATLA